MIFTVSWKMFNFRIGTNNVYYKEYEDRWDFYTVVQGSEIMKSVVPKHEEQVQDIMFFDRYINSRPNMIGCLELAEGFMEEPETEDVIEDEEMEIEIDDL